MPLTLSKDQALILDRNRILRTILVFLLKKETNLAYVHLTYKL